MQHTHLKPLLHLARVPLVHTHPRGPCTLLVAPRCLLLKYLRPGPHSALRLTTSPHCMCSMQVYGSIAPPRRKVGSPHATGTREAEGKGEDPFTAGNSSPRTPFVPPPFNLPPYVQVRGVAARICQSEFPRCGGKVVEPGALEVSEWLDSGVAVAQQRSVPLACRQPAEHPVLCDAGRCSSLWRLVHLGSPLAPQCSGDGL
jgi:hypothetical protein